MGDVFIISSVDSLTHTLCFLNKTTIDLKLIIVVNHKFIFDFIKRNKRFSKKVIFVQNLLNNPYIIKNWYQEWKNLRQIVNQYLDEIKHNNIIFFNMYYDTLAIFIISYLSNKNSLYLGLKDQDENLLIHRKATIVDLLLSLIYGIRFENYSNGINRLHGMPRKILPQIKNSVCITNLEKVTIWKNYKVKVKNIHHNHPYIIILDFFEMRKVLDIEYLLKSFCDFNVYIKLHPRQKSIADISKMMLFDSIISEKIPIEFMDLSGCRACLGLGSLALSNLTHLNIKVISMLDIVEYSNKKRKLYKDYIVKYENDSNNILFPSNINNAVKIINFIGKV